MVSRVAMVLTVAAAVLQIPAAPDATGVTLTVAVPLAIAVGPTTPAVGVCPTTILPASSHLGAPVSLQQPIASSASPMMASVEANASGRSMKGTSLRHGARPTRAPPWLRCTRRRWRRKGAAAC